MKTIHALVISMALAGLVAMGSGIADEPKIEQHSVYALKVMDGSGEPVDLRLDSAELGFDVFDLAEGDSYTFTTDDGRPVTVSNVDGEIWLDVDGELMELNGLHGHGQGHGNVMKMIDLQSHQGITIRSTEPLDEETKTRIVQAIADAGVDQEVFFAENMQFHWLSAGDLEGDYDIEVKSDGLHEVHKQVMLREERAVKSDD